MAHSVARETEADLADIWYFVATESGSMDIADRLIDTLTERFFLLARHPHMGRRRNEDLLPGLRSFPVGRYIILYSIEPGGDVLIVRVMRFLSELWKMPSVRKAAWSTEEGQAELWVMMAEEKLDDQERIHLLKREYRRRGFFPIDVHVINLGRVQEASLPTATPLFAR